MKGIILAGGRGKRLHPITLVISKQLIPIYDKPMIYYPLATLMLAGIRDILMISTPRDLPHLQALLGDGKRWGLSFSYAEQEHPRGLADAFLVGESFLAGDAAALVLGDNCLFGDGLAEMLRRGVERESGATIFAYHSADPCRFGVIEFDPDGRPCSIEEKPKKPKSNWAITGIYCYDRDVVRVAKTLRQSPRGELEISDLNRVYLERGVLHVERMGNKFTWFDTGTPESLLAASEFVRACEVNEGHKVACPEEIAFRMGFIDAAQFAGLAAALSSSGYGSYLQRVLEKSGGG